MRGPRTFRLTFRVRGFFKFLNGFHRAKRRRFQSHTCKAHEPQFRPLFDCSSVIFFTLLPQTTNCPPPPPPQLFHSLVAYIFNDFLKRSARYARSVRPRLAYFSAKTALPNRQSLHFNHEQRFMWISRYVQLTRRSAIKTLPYVIIIH